MSSDLTITDADLLSAVRRNVEHIGALLAVAESYAAYARITGMAINEDGTFGTADSIRTLRVAVCQYRRVEQILTSVLEGGELPAGATSTSDEVNEVLHPDEKPQQGPGPDPSGLFGRFLN